MKKLIIFTTIILFILSSIFEISYTSYPLNISTSIIYFGLGCLLLDQAFVEYNKVKNDIQLKDKIWLIIDILFGLLLLSSSIYWTVITLIK
ncbi:hypothetical protein CHF27_013685 [Romboutsia maritimum]|uniref:Uncharacterized protein n=1 Tax=Romboutsia maritimum TaxID=2020948 RepID=A0A371IPJ5_9FIRM|nr:hypothetical protein [Romboutsia maritimum]RDY22396.1 hypothetical protein CHF27_013685 [Romboutsia maritimum]